MSSQCEETHQSFEDLKYHRCERSESWWVNDGQGISLAQVCETCEEAKLSRYRPEIMRHYTQADVDEPIEEAD